MRSLEQFYTVAFDRAVMLQTIKIDPKANWRIDAGLWVEAIVPECYRPRVIDLIAQVFEGFKGKKATDALLHTFVDALRGAIYNRLEPIHPSEGSEHLPGEREHALLSSCSTCDALIKAGLGGPLRIRIDTVNLATRWLKIDALNAALARAVTKKNTTEALRVMKQIADAATMPESCALIYDWDEAESLAEQQSAELERANMGPR